METTISFEGGMNQDSGKLTRKQNSYVEATNMRITTYEGSSNISLTNTKGNTLLTSIPGTSNVYKIISAGGLDDTQSSVFTITINGISITTASIVETLENLVTTIDDEPLFAAFDAFLSADETYFLLTSIDGTPISSFSITSGTASVAISTYIPAQSNLIPIGSVCIRDEVFILTTAETAKIPSATGGIGQIWKLTYSDIDLSTTFTLLYNNYLNFTTYHAVAPTAIQGHYENSLTKRIYWTDYFNPLRSFNTADPDGFVLSPDLLNAQPIVTGSIPILQEISSGGSLDPGMYQVCYRLKTNSTFTYYSELSNMVQVASPSVVENNITNADHYMNYVGAPLSTGLLSKILHFKISNYDPDYERIEIIVLKRTEFNGSPTIVITHDEPLPSNGEFEFTISNIVDQAIETLTASEFLNGVFSFTHCKTLTVKDNKLIAGNVYSEITDISNLAYDSRVYRFPVSTDPLTNTISVKDGQGNTDTYSTFNTVPETHDAINPDHSTYKWQQGGTVLGGSGPNISYTFGTKWIRADHTVNLTSIGPSPYMHSDYNYIGENPENLGVTDQDYPLNSWDGMKFGYRASLFRTYQRNEIYRFGIVFYDKQTRPLFANWIGDIRMPDYADTQTSPNSTSTALTVSDYRLTAIGTAATGGTDDIWLQLLYINFTVSVPANLKAVVGGFRIVRLERTKDDKTILGCGLLNTMYVNAALGNYLFVPGGGAGAADPSNDLNLSVEGQTTSSGSVLDFTFDSPDFLLTGYNGYAASDEMIVGHILTKSNSTYDIQPAAGDTVQRIVKLGTVYQSYDFDTATSRYDIQEASEVGVGQSYTYTGTASAGWKFFNQTYEGTTTSAPAVGSKTLALGLSENLNHSAFFACTEDSYRKIYAAYYRPRANQYGGNTFSQRSSNEYISCGSFQPIETSSTSSSYVHEVFGGDTTIDMYDNHKMIRNWGPAVQGHSLAISANPDSTGTSITFFWACESYHNFNLRHGVRVAHDLRKNTGALGDGYGATVSETYDYNTVYSAENNIITYPAKPLDFEEVEEFDTRVWVSEQKENGEVGDSWTVFLPANWYDADTANGPINALTTFKDKVYFIQDNGFGIVPISERALIQTDPVDSTELQLGKTAEVIQRPEYINRTIGSKHQWSVTQSDRAIYFFDVNAKQIFQYGDQGLRAIPGLNGYFKSKLIGRVLIEDKPVYDAPFLLKNGILATADYTNNEVIFTFHDNKRDGIDLRQFSKTIVFNEDMQLFTSFMSFTPSIYINTQRNIISPDPTNLDQLYIHYRGNYGSFYGSVEDSTITLLANENPKFPKNFTNIRWSTEVQDTTGTDPIDRKDNTFYSIRAYNDYQNTGNITLSPGTNVVRRERTWSMGIPRNAVKQSPVNLDIFDTANLDSTRLFREPLRDKYCIIELKFSNGGNYRLICPFIHVGYLISPR